MAGPIIVRPSPTTHTAFFEAMERRTLFSATGWSGGEPTSYVTTLYVDGAYIGTENGSSVNPFNTVAEGVNALKSELSAGRSVKLLIKPGVYRETLPSISAGQNTSNRSQNGNITVQDTWMRIDRWGSSGTVVIDGSDDWSVGKGEGGEWTPVAGQPGVYSRTWTRNWGLWGGNNGSANISVTEGQRREMVYIDFNDGKGPQRLQQVALEQYNHTRPRDNGNASSWNGPGVWSYQGYAGLGALVEGSFGVTELSTDAADGAYSDDGSNTSYQAGMVLVDNPAFIAGISTDPVIKKSFKQIYDEATSKAPASETNRIFIKLPEGVNINDVKIEVATRETALAIEKRNYVLANLTFQRQAPRMFDTSAVTLGRTFYDWYLTNGNALIENVTVRDSNAYGLRIAGHKDVTFRNSTFDANGASGLMPTYSYNLKFEGSTFSNTGWRAHELGKRYSFVPGAMKTWHVVKLQIDDSTFRDNLYKGFYSDSVAEQLTFNNVRFENNIVGSMHEVGRGPFIYNGSTFVNNRQGLAIIQSSNVHVTDSDFINNDFAIVPEAKSRTAKDLADTYDWGGSLLGGSETPLDIGNFSLTNSRLHSNRIGARIIGQGSQYSSESKYLLEVRDNATYAGNRYYLSDHPYGWENDTEWCDFATWTAATGEVGASWDPSLSTGAFTTNPPVYPIGFIWDRSADWSRRAGGESGIARQVFDSLGQPVWFHAVTHGRVGGAIGSTTPWYNTPLDYLNLSKNSSFIYKNEMDYWPAISQTELSTYNYTANWNSKGAPMSMWRNPTERPMTLAIAGTLTLRWTGSATTGADIAIVQLKADGTRLPLWTGSYNRPSDGSNTLITPTGLGNIAIAPGDRILVTPFVRNAGYNVNIKLVDDLTYQAVNIEYPPADLGVFTSTAAIGNPNPAGNAVKTGDSYAVSAGGTDIWGTSDQFRYVYKAMTGNFTLTAQVASQTNTNAWAKAGLMIRDGNAANARHVSLFITPSNGTVMQHRTNVAGSSSNISSGTNHKWVRLVRAGNNVTASVSADGTTWTNIATRSIGTSGEVLVGLAVTSHASGSLSSATFNNVSLNQAATPVTYQAESGTITGGAIENTNAGFNGSGYYNFGTTGTRISFNDLGSGVAGQHTLRFRYANGASASRTVKLILNGVTSTLTFPPTGSWSNWSTISLTRSLLATGNTLALESSGQDGGNLDEWTLTPV